MGRGFEPHPPHSIYLRKLRNPSGRILALTHNLTHYEAMTETSSLTLTEFLLARIAEDGAIARAAVSEETDTEWALADQWHTADCGHALGESMIRACRCGVPARVLAEVEAKRRIVDEHAGSESLRTMMAKYPGMQECQVCEDGPGRHEGDIEHQVLPCPTLRFLATVYADHPDYREEWRA